MVALLHPPALRQPALRSTARSADRAHLVLIEGGRSKSNRLAATAIAQRSQQRLVAALAMVAVFLLLGLILLRVAQAVPTSIDAGSPAVATPMSTGDLVHVVADGETLWAIARSIAPDADPRPIVDLLAERNGGTAIQIGQRLVIPAELAG